MTTSWQLVLLWGVLVGIGHRRDLDGFRGDDRDPLVRGAPRTGHRCADGRQRHRAADLPSGGRRGHGAPRLALGVADRRGGRAGGGPAGPDIHAKLAAGQGSSIPTVPEPTSHCATVSPPGSTFGAAFGGLLLGARVPAFWLLAGSFAICGMTTNGLIGTHFIPAANDHGMPTTVAAGLLATVGVLDVAGTIFSGWLTDRVDPRLLLVVYYIGRGLSLLLLPVVALAARRSRAPGCSSSSTAWTGWPPCRRPSCCAESTSAPGPRSCSAGCSPSHQLGAAVAAAGAGWLRDIRGDYDLAFYLAAGLCGLAALLCLRVRRAPLPCPGLSRLPARFGRPWRLCLRFRAACRGVTRPDSISVR